LSEADEQVLAECERRDALFPDLDWRAWAAKGHPAAVTAG
jgi:hypothetical protein